MPSSRSLSTLTTLSRTAYSTLSKSAPAILPPLIVTRTADALHVSHKFVPTPESLERLRFNDHAARAFAAHKSHENRFEDVYYDTAPEDARGGALQRNNIYVRRRQWKWQLDRLVAPSTPAGPLGAGHVECVTDTQAAEGIVRALVPGAQLLLFGAGGMRELETLRVQREVFRLDERFEAHVDILTGVDSRFVYRVGEIGVSQTHAALEEGERKKSWRDIFSKRDEEAERREREQAAVERMAGEVVGFMDQYDWAFPDRGEQAGGVHGTLQAYLGWKAANKKVEF